MGTVDGASWKALRSGCPRTYEGLGEPLPAVDSHISKSVSPSSTRFFPERMGRGLDHTAWLRGGHQG